MPDPETDEITDGNQVIIGADVLATMVHQVDEIHKALTEWRPVIEAYQRGGLMGARTAARRIRQ